MLPLLAAVPAVVMAGVGLVGGAMSMAGGAMNLAGGVINAGSTMAGIAADAASGVIGAASRLTGGGKKKSSEEASEYEPEELGSDAQGKKALPPGVKLNKNGVMIQDSGGPGGGTILPGQFDEDGQLKSMDDRLGSVTADRSGADPLQQILDHVKFIGANTARTAMGIGALLSQSVSSSVQDNIDDSKPEGSGNNPKQGMVSKVFGGLTDRMKKISGSLGGVAKFMLKGAALAGLIFLFKRNEETITKAVGSIFKFFHDMYKTMQDSDDPLGDLMIFLKDKFKSLGEKLMETFDKYFTDLLLPKLQEMFGVMLEAAKKVAIEFFINTDDKAIRVGKKDIIDTSTDFSELVKSNNIASSDKVFATAPGEFIENSTFDDKIKIGNKPTGDLKGFFYVKGTKDTTDPTTIRLNRMLNKKLDAMRVMAKRSKGRVQFEGFPDLSKYHFPADSALSEMTFNKVMNAVPIIDGFISTEKDLAEFSLDSAAGISPDMKDSKAADEIRENLARMTQMIHTGSYNESEFAVLQQKNLELGQMSTSQAYEDLDRTPERVRVTDKQTLNPNNDNNIMPMNRDDVTRLLRFTDKYLRSLAIPESTIHQPVVVSDSGTKIASLSTGDTLNMPLDVHHSDPTQKLLTDMGGV